MATFSTFWNGPISAFERTCLASFLRKGHQIVLYSYDNCDAFPAGVTVADAAQIADPRDMGSFRTDGRANMAAFSDFFRYRMFAANDSFWIDSDIYLLGDFAPTEDEFIMGEDANGTCNALLRFAPASPLLAEINQRVERLRGKDLPWGALQAVVAEVLTKRGDDVHGAPEPVIQDERTFAPLSDRELHKYFLPEHLDECRERCSDARALHLYNNILGKIGYYKDLMPPEGSYLHELFRDAGAERHFIGCYPAAVARQLFEGWRMRFSGECLGIGAVARQMVPSIRRTIRRRRHA